MPDSQADGSVYRELSAEMRNGLKSIYQQISSASADDAADTDALFNEASDQLKEVVKATESAAMNIMEIVEKQLEYAATNRKTIDALRVQYGDNPDFDILEKNNSTLIADLTSVLTALSFQDITGQRIKKVMEALTAIERSVVDLYLSSGLVMEAAEKNPQGNARAINTEAQKAVQEYRETGGSRLRGPDSGGASQAAIDDMLAQLGL